MIRSHRDNLSQYIIVLQNMEGKAVDAAILAIAMTAVLLGITMLASGEVFALAPLILGLLGFAYLKADDDPISQWIRSENDTVTDPKEDALSVLRQRYARGEIDEDEFERRLNDLLETETVEQAEEHHEESLIEERS